MSHTSLTASDLRRTLEDSLLVRHIASPLELISAHLAASEARAIMEERRYTVIGLRDGHKLGRYVRDRDLGAGSCGDHGREIAPDQIVSSTTPLIEFLPLIKETDHHFVLDGARLDGIVTLADLQKSPVRMLLFGLVSLLEMYLLVLVRGLYPEDALPGALGNRIGEAQRLYEQRIQKGEEIDLADCLQMCDKRDLLLKKVACDRLGFDSKRRAVQFFKDAEDLRNRLAHSQDLVLGTTWPEVIDLSTGIDLLLGRIEAQPEFARD